MSSSTLGRARSDVPLAAFNFGVEITVPARKALVADAAFSDCDGLETTLDVKTIREGGNNGSVVRLAGPVSFGTLTLKRGMTTSYDLWEWFDATVRDPSLRAAVDVVLYDSSRVAQAVFALNRCLPAKVKAPTLNARDGVVAIEELQIAYESLTIRRPEGSGRG